MVRVVRVMLLLLLLGLLLLHERLLGQLLVLRGEGIEGQSQSRC